MSTDDFDIPNDISDFCRVCLQLPEESQYLDLSTIYDEEDNLTYGECFTICTQIDLNAGNGVPHHLCKSCGIELQMSYDFHKKILESNRVIEQCQRQLKEMDNTSELVSNSEQSKHLNFVEQETDSLLHIIDEKFVISYNDEQHPGASKNIERVCDTQEQNEQGLSASIDDNEETNEMEIINDDCSIDIKIRQMLPDNKISTPEMNENFEDHFEIEALEEEDLPSITLKKEYIKSDIDLDEEIMINTTITPLIPSGIRLPIPSGPPFICELCGHSSNTKNLLASHRHRKHRHKELPFQCLKCDKSFKSKESCEKHMKRLSCEKYPEFKCEYCEKKITGLANYEIHLRFHKKIYPFKCQECGKGFMMGVHLKDHVQTKHESKRYICEVMNCGKLFQSRQALKSHMYVHLDFLPFRCEHCSKLFSCRSKLRRHFQFAHNIGVSAEDLDRMQVTEEIVLKVEVETVKELNENG